MNKTEATKILAQEGITWAAPIIDLIDTLTYALSDAHPDLPWEDCTERADRMARAWAE